MKADKQITIEEDNGLGEPLTTNEINIEDVLLEVTFLDTDGNKHSRFIKLNSDCTDLTKIKIKDEMGKHNILKNFE